MKKNNIMFLILMLSSFVIVPASKREDEIAQALALPQHLNNDSNVQTFRDLQVFAINHLFFLVGHHEKIY